MQYKQYIILLLSVFLIVIAFAGGFNYWVNPYGLFSSHAIQGFNAIKPSAGSRVRVVKPRQVLNFKPRTLIIGNSRPEMGLDPRSKCWQSEQQAVYNFGIPGASVYMQTRYAQHALETGTVKQIYFGLDFLDFLVNKTSGGSEHEYRLLVDVNGRSNPDYIWWKFKDNFKALFSLSTVLDSLKTILAQHNKNSSHRRIDGFNPANDYMDIIETEGQSVLFRQKNQEVIKNLVQSKHKIYESNTQWSIHFESLRRFLTFAKSKGIKVVLFINPYHADYLLSLDLTGHWHLLEQWKQVVTNIVAEAGFDLWDFNAFNVITTESLEKLKYSNKTSLDWFWEPAHYRREVGELMLAQMTGKSCVDDKNLLFGQRLLPQTIKAHLQRLQAQLLAFKTANPQRVTRLKN